MKRQQTVAAVLLAALLALAVVVYLVMSRAPAGEVATPRLWDLEPGRVAYLAVIGADGGACRMERDAYGSWRMVQPSPGEADDRRLNRLVDELAAVERYRRFEPGEVDLQEVGLLSPMATIVVGTDKGTEYVLHVGAQGPQPYTCYVRWDEVVYLCPSYTLESVLKLLSFPPVPLPSPTLG